MCTGLCNLLSLHRCPENAKRWWKEPDIETEGIYSRCRYPKKYGYSPNNEVWQNTVAQTISRKVYTPTMYWNLQSLQNLSEFVWRKLKQLFDKNWPENNILRRLFGYLFLWWSTIHNTTAPEITKLDVVTLEKHLLVDTSNIIHFIFYDIYNTVDNNFKSSRENPL